MARLFNLEIHEGDQEQLLHSCTKWLDGDKRVQIATINAEFLVEAKRNPDFQNALEDSFCIADGVSVRAGAFVMHNWRPTWPILKHIYCAILILFSYILILVKPQKLLPIKQRITGVDLFWPLLELCAKRNKRVYFLGASKGVNERLISLVQDRLPELSIAGYSSANHDKVGLGHEIAVTAPDLLLVAFGAPRQELFLATQRQLIGYKIGIGLGGTFDFITGSKRRAPQLWQRLGLEWLYRFFQEPTRYKRTFRAFFKYSLLLYKEAVGTKAS